MKGRFIGVVLTSGLLAMASRTMPEKVLQEKDLSAMTQSQMEVFSHG